MDKITIERETLAGMIYPPKPPPRLCGYIPDGSGVEWNAYDTMQMEAYARAAYADGFAAALAAQPAEPSMRPLPDHDNHHNALKCPYCNPRGLKFAEPAAAQPANPEPVAWLHICVKPGRREVYATVDPDDNKWWPADQWTSHTVHPLYAAPPAPAAVPLTDEKIDHTLATTLDEFARTTRGMSHALDVNADITANSRLRRMFARAVLAAGDKP